MKEGGEEGGEGRVLGKREEGREDLRKGKVGVGSQEKRGRGGGEGEGGEEGRKRGGKGEGRGRGGVRGRGRCISSTVCDVCFGLDSLTSSICHWVSVIQSKGFFPKLTVVAVPASHEGSAASPFTANFFPAHGETRKLYSSLVALPRLISI